MASFYDDQGNHLMARRYAEKTLKIAEASGDDIAVISAELNLGGNYMLQGDDGLALPHFERVLALSKHARYQMGILEALQHLAFGYMALGRREDFLRVTAYALEHFRTAPYADVRSRLLAQRAEYYHEAGDDVRAARDAEEAIRVSRGAEEHTVAADALVTLAIVRLGQKRNAEALRLMEEVAKLTHSFGRGAIRSIGAVALWRLGRRAEAYETLRDVLRSVEVERQHVGGDERQERFLFEARVMPYKSLVAMLVADGRFEEALSIAEQSKGRLLLDLLRGGRKIAEERVPAAERQAERALERRVIDLQRRADANAASVEELRRARLDLDELRSTLYAKYPRLRMQRGEPPAATLREIQTALPDAHTAFVEYVVGDDDVIAFVVRRHSLHARRLAVGPERLGARARTFESVLLQRSLRYQPAARQLFDDLLAPLAHDLAGVDTLCIIPDGALWQVPFEALLDPQNHFVTERFASLYAPSIATFAEMMRSERAAAHGGRLLALADPSGSPALADTRREVAAIGALFAHASVLTGADASYAQIERNAGAADVLHLATHGVLDDDNPMYSRLLVAGGPLTAWQMMRLPLHARLAVLSACSTQRGGFHAGEGLIGMSWALFVGGCTSTLVSHWDVASAPTADLMIAFYREWRTSPDAPFAKSRALRRARLRLIGAPRTHHPMYWAAFVLIGADA
jgi:CHAT domain-containing protein